MVIITMEIGKMIKLMEKDSIFLCMVVYIPVIGEKTRDMVLEDNYGLMEQNSKDNINLMPNLVKESFFGLMVILL